MTTGDREVLSARTVPFITQNRHIKYRSSKWLQGVGYPEGSQYPSAPVTLPGKHRTNRPLHFLTQHNTIKVPGREFIVRSIVKTLPQPNGQGRIFPGSIPGDLNLF